MKKITALVLLAAMAVTVAACGKNSKINNDFGDLPYEAGIVSRDDMERAVANYLSKIKGPSKITICGGEEIDFQPYQEDITLLGDTWRIHNPDISYDDLIKSLEKQLSKSKFIKVPALTGFKFILREGVQEMGIMVTEEESVICVYMTHTPESYSGEFISVTKEVTPKIIPGENALFALPKNFHIEWSDHTKIKYSLTRKDGSFLYCYDAREAGSAWKTDDAVYNAAILQKGGNFKYYEYTSADMTPKENSGFFPSGETIDESLAIILDFQNGVGTNEFGSLSTWLQMCKDFKDGTAKKWNSRFSIIESMSVLSKESIAGITCDVVTSGEKSTNFPEEFVYDPDTGLLFRYSIQDEEKTVTDHFIVNKYDNNPSSLDNFPGLD
jgi:hypothetical protein